MKKMILLLAGLTMSVTSFAGGYGVIDYAQLIENSTYMKQQKVALHDLNKVDNAKLEQLDREIGTLQQKIVATNNSNQAELKDMLKQLKMKEDELSKLYLSVTARAQQAIQKANSTIDARIVQVADQLRKENNLDIIFDRGQILSYDKANDLTDKAINRLNGIK